MAKKKTSTKKSSDQLRNDAIKDIDARLNGDTGSTEKSSASKSKATSKKASTKKSPEKKPKAKGTKKDKKPRKPSGLDAAAQMLAAFGDPMRSKDIVDTMLAKGLWSTKGKTPHATIYAAIIREIQNKGNASRFEKVDRGQFQLRKRA